MRQIYLQKQFYQLARKNIPNPTEEAKHRERHLKAWEALIETGMSTTQASQAIGISRATLYRWQVRLREEGWKGLEKRSHRPKRQAHLSGSQNPDRLRYSFAHRMFF